jgi:hypothetical protein
MRFLLNFLYGTGLFPHANSPAPRSPGRDGDQDREVDPGLGEHVAHDEDQHRQPEHGRLRKIVEVLDPGQVDQVIEQLPPNSAPAAPQRFDEVPEFDYDAWRQWHC